jgi:Ner family transcriptional regulator
MADDIAPDTLKNLILATGITLSELSVQNGFSPTAISVALRKRSPFVQQVIADRLGMRPQDIWPSRYDENGSPRRLDPRGRRLASAAS